MKKFIKMENGYAELTDNPFDSDIIGEAIEWANDRDILVQPYSTGIFPEGSGTIIFNQESFTTFVPIKEENIPIKEEKENKQPIIIPISKKRKFDINCY